MRLRNLALSTRSPHKGTPRQKHADRFASASAGILPIESRMQYFHIRVTPRSNRSRDQIELDLSEEVLMSRFVLPYRQGRGIAVDGRPIPVDDIEQIRIGRSDVGSKQLWGVASQRSSTGFSSTEWYVVDISEDVTNQYITGLPGGEVTRDSVPKVGESGAAVDARKVWVVHGRDIVNRDAMFSFLRAINLDPVEWSEARRGTGRPQPYVGEVLDYAFAIAQAVVVILHP